LRHFFSPAALQRWSIKTQLTLCVLAVLMVSIALTTLILTRKAEQDTLLMQKDRELREGVRTAGILSRRVVELQRSLTATGALLRPEILADPARLFAFIEPKPVLRGMFANVFVTDASGEVLVLAEPAGLRKPSLNMANRDYFTATLKERRAIISEPLPGRLSNEPVIVFTAPLMQQGKVFGVIGGALRLASRDLLTDMVEAESSGEEVLVLVSDAHGKVLAHPARDRIMQSVATEPRMAEGYAAWLAAGGAAGGAVEPSGLFLRQPGQVLAVAGVAGPDWLVWRATPEAVLLAPLHAARQQTLVWAALIVAGASALVLGAVAWLLRPLTRLKQRASSLFDGPDSIDEGWPVVGGEIGELARVLRQVGTERSRLEQFNRGVLAKLGAVMATAPVGILFTRDQRMELISAEFCRLLGRTEAQMMGQEARLIFASSADYDSLGPLVARAFGAGQAYDGEWQFRRTDGSSFWGHLRGLPLEPERPESGTTWTLADITEQVAERAALEWSATHDALTGLANRKRFQRLAEQLLADRPASLPAALVMIDLDRFKPINDTAGHAAGDAMLKLVALTISSQVRSTDLAARLGGDEFALLLPHCPLDSAQRIAESVHAAIAATSLGWNGHALQVGSSLGVAALSPATVSVTAWLEQADAACYAVKAAGRGAVKMAAAPALDSIASALPCGPESA
jgi:diguanylate cyclase (GGDEF)-like protein/PAS domain S-box-containing protein